MFEKIKNKRVIVLSAHPDDETIGCGGTISLLKQKNFDVRVVFFTNGISSRTKDKNKIKNRLKCIDEVEKILKFKILHHFNFNDNEMDQISTLTVAKSIEKIISDFKPSIVFTHWKNDINVDHRKVYDATIVATRPYPSQVVKNIYSYEVLSSSNWNFSSSFNPNFFIDISSVYKKKIDALKKYKTEILKNPHTRSLSNISCQNSLRGNQIGVKYAEAFEVIRQTF